jgi:hypothetical protein
MARAGPRFRVGAHPRRFATPALGPTGTRLPANPHFGSKSTQS